ncbi:hypothetical protein D3C75_1161140 [compost metagenome]
MFKRFCHNGVGINELSATVFFHLLGFVAHGKNHILGEDPSILGNAGYTLGAVFIMPCPGMLVDADSVVTGLVNQAVKSPERISLRVALGI